MVSDSGKEPIDEVDVDEASAPQDGGWAERRLGQIRTALLGEELADIEVRLAQAQQTITNNMAEFESRAASLAQQLADLELQLQAEVDRATPRTDLAGLLRSLADKLDNGNG